MRLFQVLIYAPVRIYFYMVDQTLPTTLSPRVFVLGIGRLNPAIVTQQK